MSRLTNILYCTFNPAHDCHNSIWTLAHSQRCSDVTKLGSHSLSRLDAAVDGNASSINYDAAICATMTFTDRQGQVIGSYAVDCEHVVLQDLRCAGNDHNWTSTAHQRCPLGYMLPT